MLASLIRTQSIHVYVLEIEQRLIKIMVINDFCLDH